MADAGERSLPGLDVVGIGDLGGVEARAEQERREIRDQIADGPDLALEAVALAEQHGERMAAAVAEGREANGDHAVLRGSSGKGSGIGGRPEHDRALAAAREQHAVGEIKQRHREPP